MWKERNSMSLPGRFSYVIISLIIWILLFIFFTKIIIVILLVISIIIGIVIYKLKKGDTKLWHQVNRRKAENSNTLKD